MKRIIYSQKKLQRWADNEQDAFISAGTSSLSDVAEAIKASQQDESTVSKVARSRKLASKIVSVTK